MNRRKYHSLKISVPLNCDLPPRRRCLHEAALVAPSGRRSSFGIEKELSGLWLATVWAEEYEGPAGWTAIEMSGVGMAVPCASEHGAFRVCHVPKSRYGWLVAEQAHHEAAERFTGTLRAKPNIHWDIGPRQGTPDSRQAVEAPVARGRCLGTRRLGGAASKGGVHGRERERRSPGFDGEAAHQGTIRPVTSKGIVDQVKRAGSQCLLFLPHAVRQMAMQERLITPGEIRAVVERTS